MAFGTALTALQVPGPYTSYNYLPLVRPAIIAPTCFHSSDEMQRLMGRASREAMKVTLMEHWRDTIPEHFKQTARHKYHHKPRYEAWKSYKRRKYGSITDIVASGVSKSVMTSARPTVTSKQIKGSGIVRGIMKLAPWPFKTKGGQTGITPDDMAEEIERWTMGDLTKAAETYRNEWVTRLTAKIDSRPRLKKRYGAWVAAQ